MCDGRLNALFWRTFVFQLHVSLTGDVLFEKPDPNSI